MLIFASTPRYKNASYAVDSEAVEICNKILNKLGDQENILKLKALVNKQYSNLEGTSYSEQPNAIVNMDNKQEYAEISDNKAGNKSGNLR